MIPYYPVFLDLRGRPCVVVGGGAVATRKVRGLLESGAKVTLISPRTTEELHHLAQEGTINHKAALYRRGDLQGAFLVIAATDDPETNRRVGEEAQERGLLVNTVDDPQHCSFIAPSIVRRGAVTIAIATGGQSPALARALRQELEALLPPAYGAYLEEVTALRRQLRQQVASASLRERVWHRLLEQNLLELLRRPHHEIQERLQKVLAEVQGESP